MQVTLEDGVAKKVPRDQSLYKVIGNLEDIELPLFGEIGRLRLGMMIFFIQNLLICVVQLHLKNRQYLLSMNRTSPDSVIFGGSETGLCKVGISY